MRGKKPWLVARPSCPWQATQAFMRWAMVSGAVAAHAPAAASRKAAACTQRRSKHGEDLIAGSTLPAGPVGRKTQMLQKQPYQHRPAGPILQWYGASGTEGENAGKAISGAPCP